MGIIIKDRHVYLFAKKKKKNNSWQNIVANIPTDSVHSIIMRHDRIALSENNTIRREQNCRQYIYWICWKQKHVPA